MIDRLLHRYSNKKIKLFFLFALLEIIIDVRCRNWCIGMFYTNNYFNSVVAYGHNHLKVFVIVLEFGISESGLF